MKSRIPILWLALLTIYQSYVSTDALQKLKSVEANQEETVRYMAKTVKILKRIKHAPDSVLSQI